MIEDSVNKVSMVRTTGTLKWINETKGFGLITPDAGGKDLFANFPIRRPTDKPSGLRLKQKVSYEITLGADGEEAVNVKMIT